MWRTALVEGKLLPVVADDGNTDERAAAYGHGDEECQPVGAAKVATWNNTINIITTPNIDLFSTNKQF